MLNSIFKAYDIRGLYPEAVNERLARKIGYAVGAWLRMQLSGRDAADPMLQHVVVGRDMRPSSPKLAAALIAGLRASGMNVFDVGMVDTPMIYFAVNHLGCAGGVMTTASHNPIQYNGFKVCGRGARAVGAQTGLIEIQRLAAATDQVPVRTRGRLESRDLWSDYAIHVRRFCKIRRPLKVVVDASNSMAGLFIPKIFEGLKNLKIIPLNFSVGGPFAHEPNPVIPANLVQLQAQVVKAKAHLGACFDGDGDRCVLCDEKGRAISCDLLGAFLAVHFLKESPGSAVVYDLRSSRALAETILKHKGRPVRGRVGHVFMKHLMREHQAVFGVELSGHFYYRDNFCADSGAITLACALSVLSVGSQPLGRRIEGLKSYVQSGEMNFRNKDQDGAIGRMRTHFQDRAVPDDLDGISLDAWKKEGWWANVRRSNTEPLLRLNLEAKDAKSLRKVLAEIQPMLGELEDGHAKPSAQHRAKSSLPAPKPPALKPAPHKSSVVR